MVTSLPPDRPPKRKLFRARLLARKSIKLLLYLKPIVTCLLRRLIDYQNLRTIWCLPLSNSSSQAPSPNSNFLVSPRPSWLLQLYEAFKLKSRSGTPSSTKVPSHDAPSQSHCFLKTLEATHHPHQRSRPHLQQNHVRGANTPSSTRQRLCKRWPRKLWLSRRPWSSTHSKWRQDRE